MRNTFLYVAIILTISAVAVAQTPSSTSASGEEALAISPDVALCADIGARTSSVGESATPLGQPQSIIAAGGCSATADCGSLPDVSCSTTSSSATCEFADRDCAWGQRGFVRCGSSTTYCACPCGSPSSCTHGATRWVQTTQCCSGVNLFKWKQQKCTCGSWADTGATDCLVACDGSGMP